MDAIDKAILNVSKLNARATVSEINPRVSLSVPAVAERIKKLEQGKFITQYTIKENRYQTGCRLLAFVFVNIDQTAHIEYFRSSIVKHNCVLECHHVAGEYDCLLKIALEDTRVQEWLLSDTLKSIDRTIKSNTIIALTTLKEQVNV